MKPQKCGACKAKAVVPAVLADYATDLDHDGRTYPVKVKDLEVLRCDACQNIILPDEAFDRLLGELRRAADLLTPEQIAAGRTTHRLNQKELAQLMMVAPETVSRWETGAQIQQRAMNEMLVAVFEVPAFAESPSGPIKLREMLKPVFTPVE